MSRPDLPPPRSVLLAPLAGYTDEPFRRVCRRCGCRYAFTPLVDAQAVVHGTDRNRTLLHRAPDEPWLGVQLLGSNPDTLEQAARILNTHQFQILDFNLGCPVPKVRKRGAGAALGAQPDKAARCIEALRRASRFPLTAKIRVLDAADPAPTLHLAQHLVAAGIQMLSVHGRTTDQYYSGPVALEVIRVLHNELSVPVVANGGIFTAQDADLVRSRTQCSRVMLARGTIGNPWVFAQLVQGREAPPTHREVCDSLEEQVTGMIDLYGETIALRNARKIIAAYLKGRGYPRHLRYDAMQLNRRDEFRDFLIELRDSRPDDQPRPRANRPDALTP